MSFSLFTLLLPLGVTFAYMSVSLSPFSFTPLEQNNLTNRTRRWGTLKLVFADFGQGFYQSLLLSISSITVTLFPLNYNFIGTDWPDRIGWDRGVTSPADKEFSDKSLCPHIEPFSDRTYLPQWWLLSTFFGRPLAMMVIIWLHTLGFLHVPRIFALTDQGTDGWVGLKESARVNRRHDFNKVMRKIFGPIPYSGAFNNNHLNFNIDEEVTPLCDTLITRFHYRWMDGWMASISSPNALAP